LTDKKESWFDAVADIRKIHPFAFALTFALMTLATYTLKSNTSLEMKAVLFFMAIFMAFLTVIFETYRLQKNESDEGVIWRKQADVN